MPESKDEIRKRLGRIHKQLQELRGKEEVIQARYTKSVWLDKQFDELDYNQRNKLRQAELTLQLSEDAGYQDIHKRIGELEAEQIELGDDELDMLI